ncbi:MAG: YitT family protein [Clostridiales bacterium]|nr:YitT family protein [Clostridiales bacterium]
MKTQLSPRKIIRSVLIILPASAVYALAFNWFYQPNHIAYGGATGIAQSVNAVFGWPSVGVLILIINVPLFLLGWRFLGGALLLSSLFAMTLSSLFIDLISSLFTFPPMEPLLACIYGGGLVGASLGAIFLQDATTGGSDLAARLLKLKLAWLPIGRLVLGLDLLVIVIAGLVLGNLDNALYGMVSLYISTLAMDGVVYGMDTARVAYIISDNPQEMTAAISQDLARGITILHGAGAYSRAEKEVLLCAFKKRQIVALKRVVKETDPKAFLIVCDAHEVLGDGFRAYKENGL